MSEYTVRASRLSFKGDRQSAVRAKGEVLLRPPRCPTSAGRLPLRRDRPTPSVRQPLAGTAGAVGTAVWLHGPFGRRQAAAAGVLQPERPTLTLQSLCPVLGWILATGPTDIQGRRGGIWFCFVPSRFWPRFSLSAHMLTACVSEKDGNVPVLEPIDCEITASEPANVNQVFVASPFPGTTTGTIALRTADGHFLGTDRVGVVSCQRQAASAPEEWLPALRDDGWALQNVAYQTFLAADEDGGSTLRCDSDTVGFRQVFRIKCLAEVVNKSRKETKKKEREAGELELDQLRRYQSWNSVRRTDAGDVRELKKAKREGKLNEAMLDRREKLKSDK
ncbi:MAG: FRG1-like family-domain-containing protein [Olpidium bornovanus]|uniref:FRG1-like family-domain-containing protein n=1 Tax=Olpidium bornovanus TaxID=278681 RepID=A0A8H7ZT90_9FUNG|nr:MAG: FRG1-like family-domain-containing protein [Olpidium bornovanus]